MAVPYTKCGKRGDTVWQRNRYGQISYPFHVPKNPRSGPQRFVRGTFGSVSARWRTLTEPQRLSWCTRAKSQWTRRRLGQRFRMRGFYYFVRVNVTLANRGQPQVDLPPADGTDLKRDLPLISHLLFLQSWGLLAGSGPHMPEYAGLAPPPSG